MKEISELEIRTTYLSSVEGSDFDQIIKKERFTYKYAYLSVWGV